MVAEISQFPALCQNHNESPDGLEHDPYYQFNRNVLTTADTCGCSLPLTIDSAAEHV